MKIVTVKQMRRIEEEVIDKIGLPDTILMENAGRGVAEIIDTRFGRSGFIEKVIKTAFITPRRQALILIGGGNNGGDGLVVGRHLVRLGWSVELIIVADPEKFPPAARQNWLIAKKLGLPYQIVKSKKQIYRAIKSARNFPVIIDALLGIGFQGQTRGLVKDVIDAVNKIPTAQAKIIAVDLPSGLNADTGKPGGSCIKAFLTVTLGLPKVGLLKRSASPYVGRLAVADIGLLLAGLSAKTSVKSPLVPKTGEKAVFISEDMISSLIPPRPVTAHKGSSGKLFVLAGSVGMSGAAILAARAALRTGAGLVYLGVPKTIASAINAALPEAIVVPLAATDRGTVSLAALPKILSWFDKVEAAAVGPGLSTEPQTQELVRRILLEWARQKNRIPLVFDADGLNALAEEKGFLMKILAKKNITWPLVLTPHPGEMGRLIGKGIEQVEARRWETAGRAAHDWRCYVVLKGAGTVVADPADGLYVNSSGNPALATGGTGDVLTGLIGSLLAQRLPPLAAALAGVFVHGRAADKFSARRGERGLLASDLIDNIPLTLAQLSFGR